MLYVCITLNVYKTGFIFAYFNSLCIFTSKKYLFAANKGTTKMQITCIVDIPTSHLKSFNINLQQGGELVAH